MRRGREGGEIREREGMMGRVSRLWGKWEEDKDGETKEFRHLLLKMKDRRKKGGGGGGLTAMTEFCSCTFFS